MSYPSLVPLSPCSQYIDSFLGLKFHMAYYLHRFQWPEKVITRIAVMAP